MQYLHHVDFGDPTLSNVSPDFIPSRGAWDTGTASAQLMPENEPQIPIVNVAVSARPTSDLRNHNDFSGGPSAEGSGGNTTEAISTTSQRQEPTTKATSLNSSSPSSSHQALNTASQYCCDRPECVTLAPFRRKPDLARHMTTRHGDRGTHLCPHSSCKRSQSGKGFSRKDNLDEHIRRCHRSAAVTPVVDEAQVCKQAESQSLEYEPGQQQSGLWHFLYSTSQLRSGY